MTREEQAIALRSITTSEVFKQTLDSLEREAFDEFMRLPRWRRFAPGIFGAKARSLVAHIDAIRNVRERLNSLASISAHVPRKVA